MNDLYFDFPPPFKDLFRPHRYKVFYGGRGCVDEDTEISTPYGKVKIKDFTGGKIYAYDGGKIIEAYATKPKKYKPEKLYTVKTDLHEITVTANHKFLTNRGWVKTKDLCIDHDYLAISDVPYSEELQVPQKSSLDISRQVWLLNVQCYLQTVVNLKYHCLPDYCQCDEQLPQDVNNAQDVLPLQDDEPQHMNHVLSRMGGLEPAYIYDHLDQLLSRLYNLVFPPFLEGKNYTCWENYISDKLFELFLELCQVVRQFHVKNNLQDIIHKCVELVQVFYNQLSQDENLQKDDELHSFFSLDNSCLKPPKNNGCNLYHYIISYEKITCVKYKTVKHFYDIHVPKYHNYIGNGIINHNSAKSWSVARALLIQAIDKDMTILCAREIQNSINDSVHRLLREQIDQLGLANFYDVTKNTIYRRPLYRKELGGYDNGSEFIFKGLRFNSREIKSTEGVNICWIEEGQAVSSDSWDILIPTIREPNSEIWITFNPLDESDPTYQRFVINPPDNAYIRKVNYDENPYFPEVLRQEMEWLKSRDYQSYLHVWEGEVRKHSNALIFGGYFRIEDFETPRDARFYYGADFGFSVDPSTLVRCFIKDKTLYIDQEAWGIGVEIDALPQLYDKVEGSRKWPIYADNSRPETISYIRRQGFNIKPCKKWQGSIEDGIEFLKTFDIVIHPRCIHTIDEFNHYSYKVDKQTGDVLPVIVDSFNHIVDGLRYSLTGLIKGRGAMHIDSKALMNNRFKRR